MSCKVGISGPPQAGPPPQGGSAVCRAPRSLDRECSSGADAVHGSEEPRLSLLIALYSRSDALHDRCRAEGSNDAGGVAMVEPLKGAVEGKGSKEGGEDIVQREGREGGG